MIELAAAVWKTDVRAAANALCNDGKLHLHASQLDAVIDGYEAQFVRYRRKVNDFWKKCQDSKLVAESGELRALMARMGVEPDVNLDQWRKHGGMLAGACHRREAEDGLRVSDEPRRTQSSDNGRLRPFAGNGWADMLVVPAWDLPGRIRAMVFIGRQGRPEDVVVRPIIGNTGSRLKELGVAMLPVAFDRSTVVVMEDVVEALKMQHKQLRDGGKPLALVVRLKHKDRATKTYAGLAGATPVFWGMRATPELIGLARASGGRVCTEAGVNDTATKHLSRYESQVWVERTIARSRDWMAALEERQKGVGDSEGQAEVAAMSLNADERNEIRGRGDMPATQSRLTRAEAANGLSVQIGGNLFTEGRDGIRRNGEQVVNARLRIDEVITVGGAVYYRGSIGMRDDAVPFLEPQEKVEGKTLPWMRSKVLAAGKGVVVYSKGYGTLITQIAMQLHPPRHVQGADRIGWSGDPAGFVFADFVVTGEGFVREGGYPLREDDTPTVGCVAEPLSAADWAALTKDEPTRAMLWAVAAAVGADVLAPAYGLPTSAIGLVGPSSGLAARMAGWLGCSSFQQPTRHTSATRRAVDLTAEEDRHGWPVVMPTQANAALAFRTWAGSAGVRNSLWQASWYESRAGVLTGDYTRVEADASGDPGELQRPAAKLLPNFLRFLMGRNLRLDEGGPLADRVLAAMAEWVGAESYDTAAIRKAHALLDAAAPYADRANHVARAFGDLVGRLTEDGTLSGVRMMNRSARKKAPVTVRDGDRVWLAKTGLYRALFEKGLPAPDDQALTNALAESGVLLDQEERMDPPIAGWVFSAEWWDSQLDGIRGTTQATLRLVS